MPIYVYRYTDGPQKGETFEILQSISEEPLKLCPDTEQPVKRIITTPSKPIFNGSGFYETDYKSRTGGP